MVKLTTITTPIRVYSRKAFTMIELIFAIVVLAVVMLTIPMMIQVNNKALEGNVAQEAIFLVSAVLSATTTLVWDNRSLVGSDTGYSLAKILDVPTGDSVYDRNETGGMIRDGGLDEDLHRSFFDYNISTPNQYIPALASGAQETWPPEYDDAAEIGGYKFDFTIVPTREYVSDTYVAGSTFVFTVPDPAVTPHNQSNIKITEVKITAEIDGSTTNIATLRAYTCNIGEIDYAKRRF